MRRPRAVGAIVLCSFLLMLIVSAVAAAHIVNYRDTVIANHQRELRNIALILAENTNQSFQNLDRLLQQLITRFHGDGLQTKQQLRLSLSGPDIHTELKNAIVGVPFVSQIGLFDSEGRLVNLSDSWPPPPVEVGDRVHFNELKSQERLQFVLSGPVRSRTTGAWVIAFDRKMANANGEFLGVLGGTVELSHFERFFGSVTLDEGASIALARSDGTLLVRYPRVESMVGQNFANDPVLRDFFRGRDHREVRLRSPFDGKERLIAARRVSQYPLSVAVSTMATPALADWRREAIFISVLAASVVLAIGLGAFFSIRHLSRLQKRSDLEIEDH